MRHIQAYNLRPQNSSKMDVDDEDVPTLVNETGQPAAPDALEAQIQDMSLLKVPITIVTGMYPVLLRPLVLWKVFKFKVLSLELFVRVVVPLLIS